MTAARRSGNRWSKIVLCILILGAGFGYFRYMVNNPPEVQTTDVSPHFPTVEVMTAEPATTTLSVYSQGSVRPSIEMILKPEVSGRVLWVSDKLVNGGVFDAGERLLEIDPTDYKTELATSETALVRAEVEFKHAQREYRRIQSLRRRNLASDAQIDQSQRSYKLAEAQLNEAKIRREQARTNLERTTIIAPFNGRVSEEHVDLGQFLSRGEQVATLYSTDGFEVRLPIGIEQFTYLDIPQGTRGMVPREQAAEVIISGAIGERSYRWSGYLERSEGEIDPKTRLIYGVVKVNDVFGEAWIGDARTPERVPLMVGMYVKAEILGRRLDNIVTLPRSALRDNGKVLVVDEESRLRYRKVKLLRVQGDDILIADGLNPGESVCISPLLVVVDGMRVNTAPVEG